VAPTFTVICVPDVGPVASKTSDRVMAIFTARRARRASRATTGST